MNALLERLAAWDQEVFLWINHGLHDLSHRNEEIETFLRMTNELGGAWIIVILLLAIVAVESAARRGIRRVAEVVAVALLGGVGANLLKQVFLRPRPQRALPEAFLDGRAFRGFGEHYRNYSMPSGHTAFAFSIAAVLFWWAGEIATPWRRRLTRACLVILPCLTGLSRIYAGSHFPGDVLAGMTIGLLAGGIVVAFARWVLGPYSRQGRPAR